MNNPNPKSHFFISLSKSVIRILAGCALFAGHMPSAGALLVIAELLGITEEVV
jgi:hypothetical protein